jgi:hypothetical protein
MKVIAKMAKTGKKNRRYLIIFFPPVMKQILHNESITHARVPKRLSADKQALRRAGTNHEN